MSSKTERLSGAVDPAVSTEVNKSTKLPVTKNRGPLSNRKIIGLTVALFLGAAASAAMLALGSGAFVHTYANVTFPPNLAHALGTIGHALPYNLLSGGFLLIGAIGTGLVIFFGIKFHQAKKPIEPIKSDVIQKLPEEVNRYFSDDFETIGYDRTDKDFTAIPAGRYRRFSCNNSWFIVLNTEEGLRCSAWLNEPQKIHLVTLVENAGFRLPDEELPEDLKASFPNDFDSILQDRDDEGFAGVPMGHVAKWRAVEDGEVLFFFVIVKDYKEMHCSGRLTTDAANALVTKVVDAGFPSFDTGC